MGPFLLGLLLLAASAHASPEDRLADYTLWLMIFTAALAITSAVQIGFLIRNDKTARMSAEAAKKSAEVAESALIAGSRAIVSSTGFTAYWEPGADADRVNWRFRPQWRNDGKTATKSMTLYSDCELRNSLLPPGFDFTNTAIAPGPGHLGPAASALGGIAPRGAAITPQDILDVQAERKFLYLWGWARYRDVFPNTPEHISMFCWRILPYGDPLGPEAKTNLKFNNIHHNEGNTAT